MKKILICLLFLVFNSSFSKNKITLPVKSLPISLIPDSLVHVDQNRIANLLIDGLFEIGENFGIIPRLAKDIKWSKKGKRLTFSLRKSYFSDGTEIRSTDVLNSLKSCVFRTGKNFTYGLKFIKGFDEFIDGNKNLSGLKELDEFTLQVDLVNPAPLILDELSHSSCSIYKKSKINSNDLLKGAIGTGPYRLEFSSNNEIRLVKNKLYYGKNLGPNVVVFKETSSMGDFSNLHDTFDLITVTEIFKNKQFNDFRYSRLGNFQLGFNNSGAIFKNLELRKAVSLAINFEKLSKGLKWNKDKLQEGLFPYGVRGFKKRINLIPDISKVNNILKEQGFTKKNPLSFSIILAKYSMANIEKSLWSKMFTEFNMKVDVQILDQKELIKRKKAGNFNIIRYGKAAGSIDGYLILGSYLSTSRFNTPRVNEVECDRLIKEALSESDLDVRFSLYKKSETYLMSKYVVVPLASVNPGTALIRKPWRLTRNNQYLLNPFKVNEWVKADK